MRPYPYNRRLVDRRGKYRWLQLAVVFPAVISVVLHVGAAWWVRAYSWAHRGADHLTDAPVVDTVLALDTPRPPPPPPEPVKEPRPEVKPPPPRPPEPRPEARTEPRPEPKVEPVPEPKAPLKPEPGPDPVRTQPSDTTPTPAPPSAPSDPPQPEAPPLPATFAGVKAAVASRVVYVVDASGAMTSSLSFILEELARSIERLDEAQFFQVVLFREPPPGAESEASARGYEMFRPGAGLVPATRANKDAARAWARTIRPLGKSSSLPGLTAALELDPDLVFLLSRSIQRTGTEPRLANLALLNTLEELNPPNPFTRKRPAVIKTIQFIDDDPSGLLQAIASRHGDGPDSYRLLSLEELTGR